MRSTLVRTDDGVELHLARSTPSGPVTADVLFLSGGPGCIHYLEHDDLVPPGVRGWFPEPRGVSRSGGGGHDLDRAVADLELVRAATGVDRWIVLGHSWGSDLAVAYALAHPDWVSAVIGIAGHGLHDDRGWSAEYERRSGEQPVIDIPYDDEVWRSLRASFKQWIHTPDLLRRLADCPVPMQFLAAGDDIRPDWPLRQLAELVPGGSFAVVPGVPHDFWSTHPDLWREVVTRTVRAAPR